MCYLSDKTGLNLDTQQPFPCLETNATPLRMVPAYGSGNFSNVSTNSTHGHGYSNRLITISVVKSGMSFICS